MSGFTRFRATAALLLGFAFLQLPLPLQAQTAEERARQEEIQRRIERIEAAQQERIAHLEHIQQEQLVRLEQALALARGQLAEGELRQREMSGAQLQEVERALAEAKARLGRASQDREQALAQELMAKREILEKQFATQAEAMAKAEEARARYTDQRGVQMEARARALARQQEEARLHYAEAADLYRERSLEARQRAHEAQERAREEFRRVQQMVVRVKARVRLGVSLDGYQGEELDAQGAQIQGVIEDTPAEEAGLLEGDIITHLNGHSLLTPIPGETDKEFDEDESLPVQRLMALAQDLDAGDEVVLRYDRDGSAETVTFEAAEIDEPSIAIVRGDLGPRGTARVLRVSPQGRGIISLTLPDDEVLELDIQELEGLEKLKDLQIEMKELGEFEALKDLEIELKGMEELKGLEVLKDLQIDAPNLRIRSLPEGNLRAYGYQGGESPLVYSVMRGAGGYGLELAAMNPGLSEYFSVDEGLLVLDVHEESTLGILPGDVILAVGGRDVKDQADVFRILRSYEDDEVVTFSVVRKGQRTSVEGTIG